MTNLFTQLQDAIAGRLRGDSWISGEPAISVVTESVGDLESEINRRVKANGVLVVVTTPRFVRGAAEVPGELLVTVLVGIAESTRINRGATGTQKPANDIAVSVVALLMDWNPGAPWTALSLEDATLVDGPESLVTWQVRLTTTARVVPADEIES